MYLSTSEIAEGLSIGSAQTRNRLMELEAQGRVDSKSFGQSRGWCLSESESREIIHPQISTISRWSNIIKGCSKSVYRTGAAFFAAGGVLVVAALTVAIKGTTPPLFTSDQLLVYGYASLAAGGVSVLLAGLMKLTASIAVVVAKYRTEPSEESLLSLALQPLFQQEKGR